MNGLGLWCLLSAVICVLFTTFFSTITLVLRHLSWTKLDQAFTARGRSHRTRAIRDRRTQLIYAAVAWRLLSNLALGLLMVCYYLPNDPSGPSAAFIPLLKAFVVSSLMLIVFSVAVPFAWARNAGTPLLVYSYSILHILMWVMLPVTAFLQLFSLLIRRLVGASTVHPDEQLEEKQEQLLSIVEDGQKEGVVDEKEREMIESVLDFRGTTAGEIMTPRTDIIAIEAGTLRGDVLEIILSEGHSRYPVFKGSIDNIIGMLYAKDLLHDLNKPPDPEGIEYRLRKPYFVPESKSLRDLLSSFQSQKVHLAVVLDEYGGTAGVVTIEDILEELVGEIIDEYEPPQPEPLVRINERTIELDARYEIDKLNYECRLNLPEDDDYESIGGFVISKLGRIPAAGFTFEHQNLHFTILDAGPRKIHRLRVVITENGPDKSDKE